MISRVQNHCASCGAAAQYFGTKCICPCHTWKYRICPCGEVRSLVHFTITHRLATEPVFKVHDAVCEEGCGKAWPKDMVWGDCCDETMDRWEEANPRAPMPGFFLCEVCGVNWVLTDTPRGEEYQVMV